MALRKLIIGLGTGRCGTMSLAHLLSKQSGMIASHEIGNPLPWNYCDEALSRKLFDLRKVDGDVAFYYLNYVRHIVERYSVVRFICLKRDREDTINSYIKKTGDRNHWINHDGKSWKTDNKWDQSFPKFNSLSKKEAIGKYYDLYYLKAERLKREFPNKFEIFKMECLNTVEGVESILSFCEIEKNQMNITLNTHCNVCL